MIYLLRDMATASAEEEATAARLEARGYVRCPVGAWRAARQAQDMADLMRLRKEDRRPLAKQAGRHAVGPGAGAVIQGRQLVLREEHNEKRQTCDGLSGLLCRNPAVDA